MRLFKALAMVLVAAIGSPVGAQQYFGQNQVQFDKFQWKVVETAHFTIHYYPEERDGIMDAARMAERSYARLSRMLKHEFREKKPLILYRSRGDFAQNNVTGDLGEGVGGVTEAMRHRILLPFTGDYKSFEHVLAHELVHAFQYDIFAKGRAGSGLQTLALINPPLWFAEGMAEYLSLGPNHILTQSWVRDAALNGSLPTIDQMTQRPDLYFPYRYGEALWEYIGQRWGDDVIGEIMNSTPNVGIDRAFKRELGLSLEELSDEWRDAMQVKHLPQIANLDRARKFSEPLLNQRKSGGFSQFFIAPSLSPDGKLITFISQGNFLRGEVFPDLWLGDAETGKRLKRLVQTTTSPDFEELRLLYSQSAFSPDGKLLAFSAQREGRDILYVMDVAKKRTIKRFDVGLEWVTSPSWSPDGKQIVVSGSSSGLTDLYIIDYETSALHRLTNDKNGDMQPAWSPDGHQIAFVTERGEGTDLDMLRLGQWHVAIYDIRTGSIEVVPGQGGHNLNPQWSPDGKAIAYISDRTGIANVFLVELGTKEHYQLTNVIGSVSGITEYSPAITWAHQADKLAFTYFEDGDYTVWMTNNPRRLRGEPFRPKPTVVATIPQQASPSGVSQTLAAIKASEEQRAESMRAAIEAAARQDTTRARQDTGRVDADTSNDPRKASVYRASTGIRASADVPGQNERSGGSPVSVAQLLDSVNLELPDTTQFREYDYKIGYRPESIYRPSIGYTQDNYGRGLYGGAGVVLADLLGNHQVVLAGQVNGRLSEAFFLGSYTSLGSRLQYTLGIAQSPYFFVQGYSLSPFGDGSANFVETYQVARYIIREAFAIGMRPSNRFNRLELGGSANNVSRSIAMYSRAVDGFTGYGTQWFVDSIVNFPALNYIAPYVAYVSDNSLFGYTGPIAGRRFRLQVQPVMGGLRWTEFSLDYRRYVPVLFNFLTLAWRFQTSIAVGPDEMAFPKYLGRADFIRGYDREQYAAQFCGGMFTDQSTCSVTEMLGSRFLLGNVELRFPLIRRFDFGLIPISLPPVDGLFFFDSGVAWQRGQSVSLSRPALYDQDKERYLLRSYGMGVRLNLFGYALMRADYAIPLDRAGRHGYWVVTLGQSF
jgi:Tol biopolymer transport system component